ncbi:MAG: DUF262 domain-containing protein [Clostridiales bacterium]|nr:DUF262 domain-containing protein [Clostridiales bacterium]
MSIKSNLEKHTANWLKRQDQEGKLNKSISIQRKEVWDSEKKSNLIISVLLDIPIESLLFEETEGGALNVLDGKQRTLTLCAFLDDQFALSPKIRVKEIGGYPLVGMKFSTLPESLRSKVLEYELSISILRPLEAEERATVFFMRNQAVSLSKMDLSLVVLGEHAMDVFDRFCGSHFMLDTVKLTEPARRKHTDLQVLLQYLILQQRPEMGFSGAEIMGFCDDIKNGEAELPVDALNELFAYLDAALTEKRQYLKKVHIPAVLSVAQAAKSAGLPAESFGRRLDAFFARLQDQAGYVATYASGSAKRTNVQARVKFLSQILDMEDPAPVSEGEGEGENKQPERRRPGRPRGRTSTSASAADGASTAKRRGRGRKRS